jgi:hypothetical protein
MRTVQFNEDTLKSVAVAGYELVFSTSGAIWIHNQKKGSIRIIKSMRNEN